MFAPGLSSMAVPVRREGLTPVGILSIAGPSVRLTDARMKDLLPDLVAAAREIALASVTSPLFTSRRLDADRKDRGE